MAMRNFVRNIFRRRRRRIRHSPLRFSLSLSLSSSSSPLRVSCEPPATLGPCAAVYLAYFFDFERRRANKLRDPPPEKREPLLTAARLDNMESIGRFFRSAHFSRDESRRMFKKTYERACSNELLTQRILPRFLAARYARDFFPLLGIVVDDWIVQLDACIALLHNAMRKSNPFT